MLITAFVLSALLFRNAETGPVVTCHHGTVSYKFVGAPGTSFRYMGETYTVPRAGSIELVNGGDASYEISERTLPLEVWPVDAFGTRTVPLPGAASVP